MMGIGMMNMTSGNAFGGMMSGQKPEYMKTQGEQLKETKVSEPESVDLVKCPNCGTPITGRFCTECGTKKPEPVQDKFCPECGSKVSDSAKFCVNCGHQL